MKGPEAGGKDVAKIDSFKEMITRVKAAFPNVSVFANTLREVVDVNKHLWGAILLEGDNWHVAQPREITVLDRIGGGDGFVGGMLYSILKGWEPENGYSLLGQQVLWQQHSLPTMHNLQMKNRYGAYGAVMHVLEGNSFIYKVLSVSILNQ